MGNLKLWWKIRKIEKGEQQALLGEVRKSGDVFLKLKFDSWWWFFNTIYNNKNTVERADGQSSGNFWAIIQHMQDQFQRMVETYPPYVELLNKHIKEVQIPLRKKQEEKLRKEIDEACKRIDKKE